MLLTLEVKRFHVVKSICVDFVIPNLASDIHAGTQGECRANAGAARAPTFQRPGNASRSFVVAEPVD
jgi:hypothetical protein